MAQISQRVVMMVRRANKVHGTILSVVRLLAFIAIAAVFVFT